jgi:argininosuccinate lyase
MIKESFMPAFDDLIDCLQISNYSLKQISVNKEILNDDRYKYLFSVEEVNNLVLQGKSFRDAYREVGDNIESGKYDFDNKTTNHTHEGSIGNLCNEQIKNQMQLIIQKFNFDKVDKAIECLCK